jgi:hypothetical protein
MDRVGRQPAQCPARVLVESTRGSDRNATETTAGAASVRPASADFCLAQTARINDPVTPPAQTRPAEVGVRAGHHAPQSESNHTVLPLGTGLAAGLPKRTRYVVA